MASEGSEAALKMLTQVEATAAQIFQASCFWHGMAICPLFTEAGKIESYSVAGFELMANLLPPKCWQDTLNLSTQFCLTLKPYFHLLPRALVSLALGGQGPECKTPHKKEAPKPHHRTQIGGDSLGTFLGTLRGQCSSVAVRPN